jgi:hypothetical protein
MIAVEQNPTNPAAAAKTRCHRLPRAMTPLKLTADGGMVV